MTEQVHLAPRLAIWGTFDVANFGDHLFPRVFESEIRRRVPAADVRAFSPLGHLHPGPFDGGHIVEPLGKWSPARLRELASAVDLVAIGGGEIIHTEDASYAHYYDIPIEEAHELRPSEFFIHGLGTELEATHPVAWHSVGIPFDFDEETASRVRSSLEQRAYVSVRDELSRDRLVRIGVEREIAVVPDSAFLVNRLFPRDLLERRLSHLRRIGAYPDHERPLIVQGSRILNAHAEAIGRSLAQELGGEANVPVVLLEAGPCHGDGEFADAVEPFLPGDGYRIAAGATVEDIVAAISHSRGFIGISLHGNIIAVASGIPSAILNLTGYSKLDGFARLCGREDFLVFRENDVPNAIRRVFAGDGTTTNLAAIVAKIDAHFDRLAAIAERSAAERLPAGPAAADRDGVLLRRAFEARGRRLVAERLRARDERDKAAQQLAESQAELAAAKAEIQRLVNLRTFRYTAPLRSMYTRLRGKH